MSNRPFPKADRPECVNCFAYGKETKVCTILNDTEFVNREVCPFYKEPKKKIKSMEI